MDLYMFYFQPTVLENINNNSLVWFQVIQAYKLTSPSMEQLQTCYSLFFSEAFPLKQYMSLYDSLGANNLPTKSGSTNPNTNDWQTTEGNQRYQHTVLSKNKDCFCSFLLNISAFVSSNSNTSSNNSKKSTTAGKWSEPSR